MRLQTGISNDIQHEVSGSVLSVITNVQDRKHPEPRANTDAKPRLFIRCPPQLPGRRLREMKDCVPEIPRDSTQVPGCLGRSALRNAGYNGHGNKNKSSYRRSTVSESSRHFARHLLTQSSHQRYEAFFFPFCI